MISFHFIIVDSEIWSQGCKINSYFLLPQFTIILLHYDTNIRRKSKL